LCDIDDLSILSLRRNKLSQFPSEWFDTIYDETTTEERTESEQQQQATASSKSEKTESVATSRQWKGI
jgi:hypothetical protein